MKRLTLAYAATLAMMVVAADRGLLATSWLADVPAGDKIGHFLLMGSMAYLANLALDRRRLRWGRFSVLQGSALVAAVVLAEEISQLWIAHRAFELADLAADAAGIWLAGQLATRRPQPLATQ